MIVDNANAETLPVRWADQGAAGGQLQFVSFALGEDQYGVNIMSVREIKGWSEITHLPNQPEHVCGVLDLRGTMVPIIDLRCRFGQGFTTTTRLHIVIIVQVDGRQVGLIGDRVLDIVSVDLADIKDMPDTGAGADAAFLSGLVSHEGQMIALIDLANLLSMRDLEAAAS